MRRLPFSRYIKSLWVCFLFFNHTYLKYISLSKCTLKKYIACSWILPKRVPSRYCIKCKENIKVLLMKEKLLKGKLCDSHSLFSCTLFFLSWLKVTNDSFLSSLQNIIFLSGILVAGCIPRIKIRGSILCSDSNVDSGIFNMKSEIICRWGERRKCISFLCHPVSNNRKTKNVWVSLFYLLLFYLL